MCIRDSYGEDIKIRYCAKDFFYWKKLPDFQAEYGKIGKVPEQSIYHRVNETKRQKTGEKRSLQGSNLVDDGYYTLSGKGYEEGSIVGQTIAPGQTYDESNPGDEPLKIQVIGTVLDWTGKTGKEFGDELSQMGFTQYSIDSEEVDDPKAEWKIQKVIAYKLDGQGERTGETADWFRLDAGDVHLNIIVEKPYVPQPTPQETPQPIPQQQWSPSKQLDKRPDKDDIVA